MAWVRLTSTDGPLMTIHKTTGLITFNDKACIIMGCPRRVSLFYDAENGYLGIRRKHMYDVENLSEFNYAYHSGLDEHTIDGSLFLGSQGLLPFDDHVSATLNGPVDVGEEEIDYGMFYIELP